MLIQSQVVVRVIKCVIFKELVTKGITHLGCVWMLIITENWKYYNKIIFKCVNSTVWLNFKVVFVEKNNL